MPGNTSEESLIIEKAASVLLQGKLVALPTETVYGLACDATNPGAVKRVFEVKGRPSNNPLILHFDTLASALPYIDFDSFPDPLLAHREIEALAMRFWPGPLSLIVPRGPGVSDEVCNGGSSIAIRVPNHPLTLAVLKKVGRPLAAPSANPSAYISPTTAEHVTRSLGEKVDLIVDGGPCKVGVESTVLSLLVGDAVILRPGGISAEEIEPVLKRPVSISSHIKSNLEGNEPLLSPGMLKKHYSPHTPVVFLTEITPETPLPEKRGVILFSDRNLPIPFIEKRTLSDSGDLIEIANRLFATLQELDAIGLDVICIDSCEPKGLGLAIMDRLIRATSK
jgi:L-threonylcarbamoyladenylate synthase